jgi:hypothetical protein
VEIDTRGGFHVLVAEPDLAYADGGHTDRRISTLTSTNVRSLTSCYYTTLVIRARSSVGDGVGAGCQVEIFGGFGQVERGQDGFLVGGAGGALRDAAVGGGEGDQVHAVEFVTQVAPGVVGGVLGDTDEKQCEPA